MPIQSGRVRPCICCSEIASEILHAYKYLVRDSIVLSLFFVGLSLDQHLSAVSSFDE